VPWWIARCTVNTVQTYCPNTAAEGNQLILALGALSPAVDAIRTERVTPSGSDGDAVPRQILK
jgi:hypothetical protein